MPNGDVYGLLGCFSGQPDASLNERDLKMTRAFAELAAFQIQAELTASRSSTEQRDRILHVIEGQRFSFLYQPVWDFGRNRPAGFECLSRFPGPPFRTPDLWFEEAAQAGLGAELELAVFTAALHAARDLLDEIYVSFNLSPEAILSADFPATLTGMPLQRIIIEVTEHAPVADYPRLNAQLAPLREQGLRIAVDDAGAGYSSFQHIIQLRPDGIKLDMTLTRHVDSDPARRALATALIFFARETGAVIVAEGIENRGELDTLRDLGVTRGQGYLLGRPMSLADAFELFRSDAPAALA